MRVTGPLALGALLVLGCSGGTSSGVPRGTGGATKPSSSGGTSGLSTTSSASTGGRVTVSSEGTGGATSSQGGKVGTDAAQGGAGGALQGGKTGTTSASGGAAGSTPSQGGSAGSIPAYGGSTGTPFDAGMGKGGTVGTGGGGPALVGSGGASGSGGTVSSTSPCQYECTDFCLNAGGVVMPGTCTKTGYVCCNIEASPVGTAATGTQYFIDATGGNDNNDGSSETKAWKSLTKIKGAGIYNLKRGSVWASTGAVSISNATIRPYGTGPRPVINGKSIKPPTTLATVVLTGKAVLDGVKVTSDGGFGAFINGDTNEIHNVEVDGTGTGALMGIGIAGSNNKVMGCYIHDLTVNTGDTGDVNSSGGAEGIVSFAGSHIEAGFNTVARAHCANKTLGGDEGGCTEIIMNPLFGLSMEDIKYHHNLCIDTVGLFESCQGTGDVGFDPTKKPGTIKDVTVSYNVVIDSKWMYLAQTVNTIHKNVIFEHNSIIHGPRNNKQWAPDAMSHWYMFGMMFSSSNGTTVSDSLTGDQIINRNNLFVEPYSKEDLFIGVTSAHNNNLFSPSTVSLEKRWKLDATEQKVDDPGLVDVFHLSATSPAIDKASTTSVFNTDFYGNAPCGAGPDIGAVEYCPNAASKARSDEVAKYLQLNAK